MFDLLSIVQSSCDDLCRLNRIVVDNDNIVEKVVKKFRQGQGQKLNCFNTSKVTDMSYLFDTDDNKIFKDFNNDISSWDTSGVKDMEDMFAGASKFNNDISSWDTSGVTDMSWMFFKASKFNNDISSWDTSGVRDMTFMLFGASMFNGDISSWDTSGVEDMEAMFSGASLFGKRLCNWDTSVVTYSDNMFTNSRCTETSCRDCTYTPTSIPSSPSIFRSTAPSVSASVNPSSTPDKSAKASKSIKTK